MPRDGLLIGEVAERTGLSRKALRLYEARGILPPLRRTSSGYRTYPPDVLGVLHFVTQARRLGLTLAEIGSVTNPSTSSSTGCSVSMSSSAATSMAGWLAATDFSMIHSDAMSTCRWSGWLLLSKRSMREITRLFFSVEDDVRNRLRL